MGKEFNPYPYPKEGYTPLNANILNNPRKFGILPINCDLEIPTLALNLQSLLGNKLETNGFYRWFRADKRE